MLKAVFSTNSVDTHLITEVKLSNLTIPLQKSRCFPSLNVWWDEWTHLSPQRHRECQHEDPSNLEFRGIQSSGIKSYKRLASSGTSNGISSRKNAIWHHSIGYDLESPPVPKICLLEMTLSLEYRMHIVFREGFHGDRLTVLSWPS